MGRSLIGVTPRGANITSSDANSSYGWVHVNRAVVTALAALAPLMQDKLNPFLYPEQAAFSSDVKIPGKDVLDFAENAFELDMEEPTTFHKKMKSIEAFQTVLQDLRHERNVEFCYDGLVRDSSEYCSPIRAALEIYCGPPDSNGHWSIGEVHDICMLLTHLEDVYGRADSQDLGPTLLTEHVRNMSDFFSEVRDAGGFVVIA